MAHQLLSFVSISIEVQIEVLLYNLGRHNGVLFNRLSLCFSSTKLPRKACDAPVFVADYKLLRS